MTGHYGGVFVDYMGAQGDSAKRGGEHTMTTPETIAVEMRKHARAMMTLEGWNSYRTRYKGCSGVPLMGDSEYGRIYWAHAHSFVWLKVGGDEGRYREVLDVAEEISYCEADSAASEREEADYR